MASISERVSIRWLPNPPSEPTSTLVLTSKGQQFVDLRLALPISSTAPPYWALAGKSYKNGENRRWEHTIDSRQDLPAEDVAVMRKLPSGDWLEEGEMLDFDDSKVKRYEEVWRDPDVEPKVSTVLELNGVGVSVKGRAIRVGAYCQGIIQVGGEVTCERWAWNAGQGWELLYRYGGGKLPCEIMLVGDDDEILPTEVEAEFDDEEILPSEVAGGVRFGEKVSCGGYVWVVTEKSVW